MRITANHWFGADYGPPHPPTPHVRELLAGKPPGTQVTLHGVTYELDNQVYTPNPLDVHVTLSP